jgi:hypothetical protein
MYGWPGAARRPCHRSWSGGGAGVRFSGSVPLRSGCPNQTATSNPVPRAVGASKIGHPNRHGCDRNAKEADSFRWFRSYHVCVRDVRPWSVSVRTCGVPGVSRSPTPRSTDGRVDLVLDLEGQNLNATCSYLLPAGYAYTKHEHALHVDRYVNVCTREPGTRKTRSGFAPVLRRRRPHRGPRRTATLYRVPPRRRSDPDTPV